MIDLFTGVIAKYFLGAALAVLVGVFTKITANYFGNDRTAKIKESIVTAMLWAEEQYGIGQGNEKWTVAWNKLIELLQDQNIKLKTKEIKTANTIMKSTIPGINQITYSTMPEKAKEIRDLKRRTPEADQIVKNLKTKYATGPE